MTNDTNTTASMHITMDDTQTPPEPAHYMAHSLVNMLIETVTKHINMLVETKFHAMLQSRNALKLMDDTMEAMIERRIEAAIAEHVNNEAHYDHADIEQLTADQTRETLAEYARRQEGWVTEDQVKDIITAQVDEEIDGIDWEDRVKDVLREML